MADVMELAKARREKLKTELAKLEEFIQTGESLLKWHQPKDSAGLDGGISRAIGSSEASSSRTGSSVGAAAAGTG
jgi:hypothetical protein